MTASDVIYTALLLACYAFGLRIGRGGAKKRDDNGRSP